MTWIWSIVLKMGDRPPWTQNILLSTNYDSTQKDELLKLQTKWLTSLELTAARFK